MLSYLCDKYFMSCAIHRLTTACCKVPALLIRAWLSIEIQNVMRRHIAIYVRVQTVKMHLYCVFHIFEFSLNVRLIGSVAHLHLQSQIPSACHQVEQQLVYTRVTINVLYLLCDMPINIMYILVLTTFT